MCETYPLQFVCEVGKPFSLFLVSLVWLFDPDTCLHSSINCFLLAVVAQLQARPRNPAFSSVKHQFVIIFKDPAQSPQPRILPKVPQPKIQKLT